MSAKLAILLIPAAFPLFLNCDFAGRLTLSDVLNRMQEREQIRSASLSRYTCFRRYVLTNDRFHITAEMSARMTYTYPGRKQFQVISEHGPAIIRKRILREMIHAETEASADSTRERTEITPSNYEFRLLRFETQQDRPAYVLEVTPKSKNKFSIHGKIWVDAQDFAIIRTEAAPAKNPSGLIRNTHIVQEYGKLRQLWLPLFSHSQADSLIFGRTEVTVDSSDYDITKESDGLSSSLEHPEREPQRPN